MNERRGSAVAKRPRDEAPSYHAPPPATSSVGGGGPDVLKTFPVLTNCARLKVAKTLEAFHYDVAFVPEFKDEAKRRDLIGEHVSRA